MDNAKFARWCEKATAEIKYTPDRLTVAKELQAHMEDHREALMEKGLSAEEAEQKALAAMGSADEIAPQLAAIHKPFWGYAYHASKIILLFCMIAFFCVSLYQGHRFLTDDIYATADYSNADFNPFSNNSDSSNIFYEEPGETWFDQGYLIQITKVSCWDDPYNSLHFQVDVSSILPLCDRPDFCYYFSVRDSLGNVYLCRTLPQQITGPEQLRYISGRIWQTSQLSWTYDALIPSFDAHGIEWIEVFYERDGRSYAVRIDLPGGETA